MDISKDRLNDLAKQVAHRTCNIYKHAAELPYHFSERQLEVFVQALMKRIEEE